MTHQIARIRRRYAHVQMGVGSIFVAIGYELDQDRGVPWLVRFSPGEDEDSWEEFMRRLPGQPVRVVTDAARAFPGAVARAWPGAVLFRCEYHLRANAEERLVKEGVIEPDLREQDPLWRALLRCFRSPELWAELRARAVARQATGLLVWMGPRTRS